MLGQLKISMIYLSNNYNNNNNRIYFSFQTNRFMNIYLPKSNKENDIIKNICFFCCVYSI